MRLTKVIASFYLLALGGCFLVLEDYGEYQRVEPDAGTLPDTGLPDTGTPLTCADSCYPPALGGMPGVGECKAGKSVCQGDDLIDCIGAVGPSLEICDTTAAGAKDEDCSGDACIHSTRWDKRFGDLDGNDVIEAVAATMNGGVVFSGFYTGTFNIGGPHFVMAGAPDSSFVAMLDPSGEPLWIRHPIFNGTSTAPEQVRSIAVNAVGTIYTAGSFVWMGVTHHGYVNVLNPTTGAEMSQLSWGGAGSEGAGMAIATAPNGDAIVAGTVKGTTAAPCSGPHTANTPDMVLARVNSSATCTSARVFSNGPHTPTDVAVRLSDDIVVVGTHSGILEGAAGASAAQPWGFILNTSSNTKTTQFIRSIIPTGTMGQVNVAAVTVDVGEEIFVTGTVRHGATIEGQSIPADPEGDAFVLGMGSNGIVKWIRQIGGAGEQRGLDILFYNKRLLVSGSFDTALDVGPGITLPSPRGPFWVELDALSGAVKWVHTLAQSSSAPPNADRFLLAPIQGAQPGIILAGTSLAPVLLHDTALAGTSVDVFIGSVETQ